MELTQHGFLEELLTPRRDSSSSSSWTTFVNSGGVSDFFTNSNNNINNHWMSFDSFDDQNPNLLLLSSNSNNNPSFINECCPFTNPNQQQQSYPSFVDESFTVPDTSAIFANEDFTLLASDTTTTTTLPQQSFEETKSSSVPQVKVEEFNNDVGGGGVFKMGLCGGDNKRNKSKRVEGQPSKNLMAERRRRKRLNDRLSMLRSIVPKISKMDRTSILGDTIDYMKELLERINKLQEEESEVGMMKLLGDFNEPKPNEVLVRNSPKFDVERRDSDTKVEICCGAKPGLLLSTVNTLEALGLEIQQCVTSCFNDFSLQASCSEVSEQRPLISCEEIKQALFRNAGYGGRLNTMFYPKFKSRGPKPEPEEHRKATIAHFCSLLVEQAEWCCPMNNPA
ncbi:hypothetical protein ACFE04_017819 [Oxalis oulophora]